METLDLMHEHVEDLIKSGLSEETIKSSDLRSLNMVDAGIDLKEKCGFWHKDLKSALEFKYPGTNFRRWKVFYRNSGSGKGYPKYLQPKGESPHLYIPAEVRKVLDDTNHPLLITEGEKKALKATQEGLLCLGLAGLWCWAKNGELIEDFEQIALKDREVILVPDNDWLDSKRHSYKGKKGKAKNLMSAVLRLKEKLQDRGAIVKVVPVPEGLLKGLDDWLCVHKGEEVWKLPEYEFSPEQLLQLQGGINRTDLGNARRLIAHHGQDIRYFHEKGIWLIWNGMRWCEDFTGKKIMKRAIDTVGAIRNEASQAPEEIRRSLFKHALSSENKTRLEAMIKLAQKLKAVTAEDIDKDMWMLNVKNGTVDLRTGRLREHRRGDMMTKLAPVDYDLGANCNLWDEFLERIFKGNRALISYVQRLIGYCLTGDISEQVFFVFHGIGANGKSTLINVINSLLKEYVKSTDFSTFLVKDRDRIPNDLAALNGARLVSAIEMREGRSLDESVIKSITGGDPITARFLHKEYFTFTPQFKILLACNHKPRILDNSHAMWRRVHLVPFEVSIPEAEQDKKLGKKLRAELSGILRWAVEGCLAWQKEGLNPPEEVKAAIEEYRSEMDVIEAFMSDCCKADPEGRIQAKALHTAYFEWCRENGERFPLGSQRFNSKIEEKGFGHITSSGRKFWLGIKLEEEAF